MSDCPRFDCVRIFTPTSARSSSPTRRVIVIWPSVRNGPRIGVSGFQLYSTVTRPISPGPPAPPAHDARSRRHVREGERHGVDIERRRRVLHDRLDRAFAPQRRAGIVGVVLRGARHGESRRLADAAFHRRRRRRTSTRNRRCRTSARSSSGVTMAAFEEVVAAAVADEVCFSMVFIAQPSFRSACPPGNRSGRRRRAARS